VVVFYYHAHLFEQAAGRVFDLGQLACGQRFETPHVFLHGIPPRLRAANLRRTAELRSTISWSVFTISGKARAIWINLLRFGTG
jgi:hypothetical protein